MKIIIPKIAKVQPIASIGTFGGTHWCVGNTLHREGGPAAISRSGDKHWFKYGQLHREDGPAVEWNDGVKEWWLDGKQYNPIEWLLKLYELTNEH